WLDKQERRLAEERKQRAALLKLETALKDDGAPREELERLYRAVMMRDGGISEDLEVRYRTHLDRLKTAAARRRQLPLAVGVAAGLVVGGLVFHGVNQARQEGRLTKAVQEIKKLRDAGALTEAKKYLDDLESNDPHIASAPELVALRKQVLEEYDREQHR